MVDRFNKVDRPVPYVWPPGDSGEPVIESGVFFPEDWTEEDRRAFWERVANRDNNEYNKEFAQALHEALTRAAGLLSGSSEETIEEEIARGSARIDLSTGKVDCMGATECERRPEKWGG